MRALKMMSAMAGHQKLTKINWEEHQNWSSYNYKRSCWRTQHWPFLRLSSIWNKLEGEKAQWVGTSWADQKSKKSLFWSVIFSYSVQQQWTISPFDCDMWLKVDFIWQPVMTSSVVGLRSSKALLKAKLAPRKGHGHCLVVCCPSDPLQLSESQWNHYIWKVCSANQWDARKTIMPEAGIGQQNGPNCSSW